MHGQLLEDQRDKKDYFNLREADGFEENHLKHFFRKELRLVALEKRLNVFYIRLIGRFVHGTYELINFIKVFEIAPVDEAVFRNEVGDVARAPIDGDVAGCKAVKDLFGDIPLDVAHVLIADAKAVVFDSLYLIIDYAAVVFVSLLFPSRAIKVKIALLLLFKKPDDSFPFLVELFRMFALFIRRHLNEEFFLFKRRTVFDHGSQDGIVKFEKFLVVDKIVIPRVDPFKLIEEFIFIGAFLENRRLPQKSNQFFLRKFIQICLFQKIGLAPDDDVGELIYVFVVFKICRYQAEIFLLEVFIDVAE
jgi:hypothetical protein